MKRSIIALALAASTAGLVGCGGTPTDVESLAKVSCEALRDSDVDGLLKIAEDGGMPFDKKGIEKLGALKANNKAREYFAQSNCDDLKLHRNLGGGQVDVAIGGMRGINFIFEEVESGAWVLNGKRTL
ncbi:hypothetical protein [Neptuniibacter sp. QD37_11]|uniref:hypothetical protein n=1 Tax=Neptuniibacter sp. QD37_11 TaxID=3398209 RepID=UPI0039F48ABC